MNDFAKWLKKRLVLPLPGYEAQQKMISMARPRITDAPRDARKSGVLIVLYPENGDMNTILIERTKDGGIHSGQIALPGGQMEAADVDIYATALREAEEEVGLNSSSVVVLGQLTELYIPVSNFLVMPVVAYASTQPRLIPSEVEVAQIICCPLNKLFANKKVVDVRATAKVDFKVRTIAYVLDDGMVMWGATAMIFSELEHLWNEFSQQ
jgi:hypothetical protein